MLDLTPSETKIVLLDVLAALSDPEALEQARSVAGNDMLRQMQTVFPLSVQIEAHVLAQHGLVGRPSSTFDDGKGPVTPGEAVVQFHQLLQLLAPQDPEIDALFKQLRLRLLPSS